MIKHNLTYAYDWEKYLLMTNKDGNIPSENVFYYTTTDTFKKIIENGCLFASHIKYMNDWQEFNSGYEYIANQIVDRLQEYRSKNIIVERQSQDIQDAIQFFRQGPVNGYRCTIWDYGVEGIYEFGRGVQFYDYCFPQVYNISFTKERDLLSQWKMYARESGIAIEFDFKKSNFFSQKVKNRFLFGESLYPQEVIYNLDEELMKIEFDVSQEEVINSKDIIRILEKVPFIKNKYYKAEDECRLIFRPYKKYDESFYTSDIKFRESNHVLIPYLEIYCLDKNKEISWPIISLTVGPGNNQDVVFSSIIYFVENISENIYGFTVNEFIDSFERFYTILINRIKKELWEDHIISIQDISDKFKKAVGGSSKLCECYSKGDFRSAMEEARNAIHKQIISNVKDEEKESVMQIFSQFETDYYLASNGIIIQKSKAPYIFN